MRPKDDAIRAFVAESNWIEGIEHTTAQEEAAHFNLLSGDLSVTAIVDFVRKIQPDARFRNSTDVPSARVGNHLAPPSGPDIESRLRSILGLLDPWEQHVEYEKLHPFTDGNGRSGRAIWLYRHYREPLDGRAIERGFLHSFYYQTLSRARP